MRNLAIIPARSGSKGLADKNIRKLAGIPLIGYSIQAARESEIFDEVMVSTDSEIYAHIAEEYKASVPFLRSAKMSSDSASSWDTVKEVLNEYRKRGKEFSTVCLLQPTSPLRQKEDILGGYELLRQMQADAVTAVCETDHSPLWSMILPADSSLSEYRKSIKNVGQRQKLQTYYRINGALYIRKIQYGSDDIQIRSEKEYAYRMDRRKSIDIDVLEDFEMAEFLMKKLKAESECRSHEYI